MELEEPRYEHGRLVRVKTAIKDIEAIKNGLKPDTHLFRSLNK